MVKYLVRVLKYAIYLAIILVLMLVLVFYTSSERHVEHFWQLIPSSNVWQLGLFLAIFAFVYPLIGFTQRKVYLNRPFAEDRDTLIEGVLLANYQIESDNGKQIVFRSKSAFTRFMRMYEDRITLDYSDNPIVLNGMRRDIYRFARNMEYVVRQLSREE